MDAKHLHRLEEIFGSEICEVLYLPLVQEFYELQTAETGSILMANIAFIFSLLIPSSRYYDCFLGSLSPQAPAG